MDDLVQLSPSVLTARLGDEERNHEPSASSRPVPCAVEVTVRSHAILQLRARSAPAVSRASLSV